MVRRRRSRPLAGGAAPGVEETPTVYSCIRFIAAIPKWPRAFPRLHPAGTQALSHRFWVRGEKKKKTNHPAPQSPQHSKKNVFEPCGGKWDKCGDASEPDWKRGVPFILPQGTLLYKALMEAGCVLPTPGYSGGCPLPPSPPPMPAGSEDTGVRFKTGSEVQRGRVTHYAATCGKLLSSIAQPNKWRLGEKAPVWRLSWRQRGRGRWAVIRDPPTPIKYK